MVHGWAMPCKRHRFPFVGRTCRNNRDIAVSVNNSGWSHYEHVAHLLDGGQIGEFRRPGRFNGSQMSLEMSYAMMVVLSIAGVVTMASARHSTHPREIVGVSNDTSDDTVTSYDAIYSDWSSWGRCNRKCRQVRSRSCTSQSHCGSNILREERSCRGGRCRDRPIVVPQSGEVTQRGKTPSEFRVLYHLQSFVYSSWSDWTPCTRACRTRRYRTCEMAIVCGKSVIQEDALCYMEGSVCEKLYKKKKVHKQEAKEYHNHDEEAEETNHPHPLDNLKCGIPKIKNDMSLRIIGGRESTKGRWPWQVAVLNRFNEPFCGGTLLAPQWVLTAAHCVRRRLYVRVGEHDLVEVEGTEQEVRVAEALIHPDYDEETVDNDIALLRLRSPLVLDDYVQPACLPMRDDILPFKALARILGWGKRRNGALYGTDVLHEAEVPVVTLDDCKEVYEDYYISDNMLCAGYRRGKVDSCAGDSGGPLLYQKDGKWTVYGVTSFGEGCGRKGKYGIYAKVASFVRWIRKTILKYDR